MLLVPTDNPFTTPDADPIVATVVLPLVHTPPPSASLSVVDPPIQTAVIPVMGDIGFTVTVVVIIQPVEEV